MQSDKKHLILKYPTRQRPGKFMNNLRAYMDKASGKNKITYVISMDSDDLLLNNSRIKHFLENLPKTENTLVEYHYGERGGKIAAINRDVPSTDWDIIVSTADDMEPVESGWDEIIVQDMVREFPNMDGSLNYNNDPRLEQKGVDGFKTLITLPVIGRKLYDKFGYIYHPDYKSEWCDNEQTEVFESLGVLRHINSRPIIHKWAENQDALMQHNMHVGSSHDRDIYLKRKSNNFQLNTPESSGTPIIQLTLVKNELHLIKYMLPIWKKFADGFIFMDDQSTDGTYEYLIENSSKYNIISVSRTHTNPGEIDFFESTIRQKMFDEAFKYTGKMICLDADEYLDGNVTKEQLNQFLENNKDTLFYCKWIQYVNKNEIRVDGKWRDHPVDRIASYSKKAVYKPNRTHGEHLPLTDRYGSIDIPQLFVSHLSWLADRRSIAIKQYHYKIWDYVNKLIHKVNIIDPVEYDRSVNNFNWTCVPFPFELRVPENIYAERDKNIENTNAYRYIKENVKKYSIPNLNDWGFGIH